MTDITKKGKRKRRKSESERKDKLIKSQTASLHRSSSASCSDSGTKSTDLETYFSFLNEPLPDSTNYKSKLGTYKLKTSQKWFDLQYNELLTEPGPIISPGLLLKIEHYAEQLLELEVEVCERQKQVFKPSETSWLKNVTVGGTVSDKIAALIVQIYENPLVSLHKIQQLVCKVCKSNRRESLLTAESFRDLCSQYLLPDRKLVPFKNRPLAKIKELSSGNNLTVERRLIFWHFENQLKIIYEDFVRRLESIAHDTVDMTRIAAVGIMTDLLINKPEQEKFLLCSIANKLGDPSVKVASKVVTFLIRLVESHPNMGPVVVEEVRNVVYRLNIAPKAQYHAVTFLSHVRLSGPNDAEMASKLIHIYFGLFKILVQKGSLDNRMLALLLRGTNKAFLSARSQNFTCDTLMNDIDALYKVTAVGNAKTSVQAMLLILQVLQASEGVSDRFYCSLYRKLLDPAVMSCGSHSYLPTLFHLLYKALKGDVFDERVYAILKRLLQLSLCSSPPFACAVLCLVSEVMREKPALHKVSKKPQNISFLDNLGVDSGSEDDDEEHFRDVHGPESESESEGKKKLQPTVNPSWVHKKHTKSKFANKFQYDPHNRNPMFANATTTLLYELNLLKDHYHPSVALFAQKVLKKEPIEYSGDPLQDFTLMRFLDRFSYRNPKKRQAKKDDASNMDDTTAPVKKLPKKTSYTPWGVKNLAVTSEDYAKAPADQIPVDERFLHSYMRSFGPKLEPSGCGDEDDDASSVGSEEFDRELRQGKLKIPGM